MALIVEYHVVANSYPVGTTAISAGMTVSLDTNGDVVPTPTGQAVGSVLGVAGDSRLSAEGQTTAYSDQVRIGANGGTNRWTENRVSDFYNETLASDKITVYTGGGKFWISEDLFDTASGVTIGALMQRSGTTAGYWATGATVGQQIAVAVGTNQAYPSGVPGTDVSGSITLGNYVPVNLRLI